MKDRITIVADLLMGAAYADDDFKDREREEVREMLADLSGSKLSQELEDQIAKWDPKKFDLTKTAAQFKGDSEDDRRRLLFLVAAINDADEDNKLFAYLCHAGLVHARDLVVNGKHKGHRFIGFRGLRYLIKIAGLPGKPKSKVQILNGMVKAEGEEE